MAYNSGASIFDWKRENSGRKTSLGTVSWVLEVPTKKTIRFVTEAERATQQFSDIYEAEEAWKNYATMVAMVYGPAWYEPLCSCGRRLRELHFSDPAKYHLKLILYLSDLGMRHACQLSEQLASNPEFQPSREQ